MGPIASRSTASPPFRNGVTAALLVRCEAAAQIGWFDPAFFVYSDEVDFAKRLRDAGWRPVFDNPTALGVLLEQVSGHHALASRRVGRRDAAVGAAGAAVAVVGTAALVRRARKKRRG